MRPTLISAIAACAEKRCQRQARRFLEGLSRDELEYIAGFLGGCVLAGRIVLPHRNPDAPPEYLSDGEHKMILLREYLGRCHPVGPAASARAATS